MSILFESHIKENVIVRTAEIMMAAARTAPKAKGIDNLVISMVQGDTIKALSHKLKELAQNGDGPDYLSGGTFTVTNIGMFGMESFTPIINKPEVAILGINRIAHKPVALNKEVVIRPMMNLSLTTDHSLVDGALSAKFLKEVVDIIENPYLLIN